MDEFERVSLRERFRSARTVNFTESVIREMTRLALEHRAVNLAQGFPDFSAPEAIKEAARQAISADFNQYAITWGAKPLRDAIAAKYRRWYGLELDPEREITVCCGATESMISSLLAVINPGDEVVVFEPFYENYGPDTELCGAVPRMVSLRPPEWTFDPAELRQAFTPRTKAIIVNTPNNPTGKVFSRPELELIAQLCQEFDALAITDEIYEHILYDGAGHIPIMTLPGMRRPLGSGEQHEQDLLGDRLAGGLGAGRARPDGLHPESARFRHSGRCGAPPASRGAGPFPAPGILPPVGAGV